MKEKKKKSAAKTEHKYAALKGLKELIAAGKEKGQLTYEEVNNILPDDVVSSEDIDKILRVLSEENIKIVDEGVPAKKETADDPSETLIDDEPAPLPAPEPQKEETEEVVVRTE
ncbi:MAG: RNA polymerase sigma factor region1.1 domain-containing protein, partial [Candidatus Omnitrophota bacterium]